MDAVFAVQQLPRPGLIWSTPELEPHTAEALSAFQDDHFIYVGEPDHGYTDPTRVPRHPAQKFRIVDSTSIKEIPSWPT